MSPTFLAILAMLTFCVGTVVGLRDNSLIQTKALPNGAASTVTDGFDLETASGEFLADVELDLTVPALTATEVADTQTITYIVETSATPGFGSVTTLMTLQTVTGSTGVAALNRRVRLPSTVQRYVRVKATKTGASNASTSSMTVSLLCLG
jgi:hypothetical protein